MFMQKKGLGRAGGAFKLPTTSSAARYMSTLSFIAFSIIATLPATVSANGVAWSPYEEFLMMMAFIFMFNLPINLGTYTLLLWLSSGREGAGIFSNKTRHLIPMTVFVAVAATFFGALIDIFTVMNYVGTGSFLSFFVLGILSVILSFIMLGIYFQRLDLRRASVVAAGIGVMNLVCWGAIFFIQVTPFNILFMGGAIAFSITIVFLFSIWHASGYEPENGRLPRIKFTRREGRRAGVLGVIMLSFVMLLAVMAEVDEPYHPEPPISGTLYCSTTSDYPNGSIETFILIITMPSNPPLDDVNIKLYDVDYNEVPIAYYTATWRQMDGDDGRLGSYDRLTIYVPGVDILGYRVVLSITGYAGVLMAEVPV
jgi:hypothetical protein